MHTYSKAYTHIYKVKHWDQVVNVVNCEPTGHGF